MKKFLVSVLLLPVLAFAQEPVIVEKQIVCSSTKIVIDVLLKDFSETPSWIGQGDGNTYFSLFTNKNGGWTLIQFNDEVACVVGAGYSNNQIFSGPST